MKIIQRLSAWSFGLLLLLAVAAPALATEVVTYYHLDAAGTTVATTNSSGTLLWREHYYPYGERLKTDAAAAASTNPLWYTGQVEDNDAGLMYYGARWYNPQIGRFMSMDPAGVDLNNVQSFNRYAYANNNPYRFVDPDGRIPIPVIFALGRAVYPLLVAGVDAWALSADAPGTRGGFSKTPVADGVQQGISTARAAELQGAKNVDEGVIYRVVGSKTESGKPYIGSANDLPVRAKTARDGRDRTDAEVVGTFPKGDWEARRAAEQRAINANGGVANLDNYRNEIAPSKWWYFGIE